MHIGHYISGAGHLLLILWLLFGGWFEPAPEPFEVTEVAVLSETEFAALIARSQPPESTSDIAAPPAPEPVDDPAPQPPAGEPAPQQTPEPEAVATPEPDPAPEAPQAPPAAEVTDTAPVLEPPSDEAVQLPDPAPRPEPRPAPAPRVAPEPVAPPEPDTAVAETAQEAVVAEESPEPAPSEPEQQATAPEAASTEIVTEADEQAASAPTASIRPRVRPARPTPPEPQQAAAPAPEAEADDTADAVADAVAQALAGGTTAPQPNLPVGPPMTSAEREALRVAVQRCWVVDVGSQSANVTVTVAMQMGRDGKVAGEIELIGSEGGPESAVDAAFRNARSAILRCQLPDGYALPDEKYDQWREIEMTFNPDGMRLR